MDYLLKYAKSVSILLIFFSANIVLGQVASFDYQVGNSGSAPCAPVVINLTNTSTGSISSYSWTDNASTFSSLENPIRTKLSGGTFKICLEVTFSDLSTDSTCQDISIFDPPSVSLSQTPGTNCDPNEINLTVNSDIGIANVFWDFGDGNTISGAGSGTTDVQNHIYPGPGSYTVTAVVDDINGCQATAVEANFVIIDPPYEANFDGSPRVGCTSPLDVVFSNTSSETTGYSFAWDFGDGNTSTAVNPTHQYNGSGAYTVVLIATEIATSCEYTETKTDFVAIGQNFADFNVNVVDDSDCSTKVVEFVLAGDVTAATWDFGDGNTSTDLNPTHTYTTKGCFTPTVNVTTADNCTGSKTADDCITSNGPVSVSYTDSGNTTSCDVTNGITVSFTGVSPEATAWAWDFGGEGTSTDQNPSFTFSNEGSFPVTLTVTYADGCEEVVSTTTVNLNGATPNFNSNYREGCAPLPIEFTDLTNIQGETITAWAWDFGFTTSTDQNPTVTFPDAGTYDVTLTVTTASGCSGTRVQEDFINLGELPTLSFTADPLVTCVEDEIQFTNNSSDNVQIWEWDFGDGGSSSEMEPSHEYQDTGRFDVMLIGIDNSCRDTLIIEEYVQINAPIARFNFDQVCGGIRTISFRDTSVAPDTWEWDFGDGSTSTDQHPTHTYSANGAYNVTLKVTNVATGCEHEITKALNVADEAQPVFSFPTNQICVGDTIQVINNSVNSGRFEWIYNPLKVALITNSQFDPTPYFFFPIAGDYNDFGLKVVDDNGCESIYMLPDVISVTDVSADFSSSAPTGCNPFSVSFTESSTSSAGTSIIEYLWDFGDGNTSTDQNPTHNYTQGGTYDVSLTVTTDAGCSSTLTKAGEVVVDLPITGFTFDVDDCNGSVVSFTNTSTSVNSVTYSWDFGDGNSSTDINPTHTFATQADYTITLTTTNSFNCTSSFDTLIILSAPTAEFMGDNLYKSCPDPPLVTNFSDLSTDAVAWEWDFGDGSPTTNLQNPAHAYSRAGTYTVCLTVTNQYGCTDTECKIDYIEIDGPTGTFDFTPKAGCAPLEVTFTATGTNIVGYQWDFGDGAGDYVSSNTGTASSTHTYTAFGQHTPVVIIEDVSGCKVPVLPDQPVIVESINIDFIPSDTVFCEGSTSPITFLPVFDDPSLIQTVEWDFTGSDIGTSSDALPPGVNYTTPGKYTVGLKVTSQYCRDSITKTDLITIHHKPTAAYSHVTSDDGCEPETIQFTDGSAIGGGSIVSWDWDNGDGEIDSIPNPSFDYIDAGDFPVSLTVTSNEGCTDTQIETIPVAPGVTVDAGEGTYLCIGESYQLSPTAEGTTTPTFDWTPAVGLSCTDCPNPMAAPVVTTQYTLTVTSPEGCMDSDTVTIEVSPFALPVVGLATDTFMCRGATLQLIARGGEDNFSYQWDDSRPGLSCYENCFNPIATPEVTTTYVVTVTGQGGCVSVDSTTIEVIGADANILGEDRTICEDGSVELEVLVGTNPVWTPPNGLSCTNCPNPIASPDDTTTYTVTVDYDRGCLISEDIVVNVQFSDAIDAGQDTSICPGTSVNLMGSYPTGGTSEWFANGSVVGSNTATPSVSPTEPTTYRLEVTEDLCTLTDSVNVGLLETIEIVGGEYDICEGEEVQVNVTGNATEFSWTPIEGLSSANIPDPVVTPAVTTEYIVTGTSGTCTPDTAIVTVNVHSIVTPELEDYVKFGLGDEVRLNAEPEGNGNYEYLWTPPQGLSCIVCPKTIAAPDSSTTYTVEIIDLDYGCTDTMQVLVDLIIDCAEESIIIPNAFTPNGDGNNDVFYIRGSADVNMVRIFDRWGNLVFESDSKSNGWDGKVEGEYVNRGVFVYHVEAICRVDGSAIYRTGDITVIR